MSIMNTMAATATPGSTGSEGGVAVWEWNNEFGRWRPYEPHVSQFIEQQYNYNKTGSAATVSNFISLAHVDSALSPYELDFTAMQQNRYDTGMKRSVRRCVYPHGSPAAVGAVWQWEGDHPNQWHSYDMEVACILEDSHNKRIPTIDLRATACGLPYTIDLQASVQTRINSGFQRNIRRHIRPFSGSYTPTTDKPGMVVMKSNLPSVGHPGHSNGTAFNGRNFSQYRQATNTFGGTPFAASGLNPAPSTSSTVSAPSTLSHHSAFQQVQPAGMGLPANSYALTPAAATQPATLNFPGTSFSSLNPAVAQPAALSLPTNSYAQPAALSHPAGSYSLPPPAVAPPAGQQAACAFSQPPGGIAPSTSGTSKSSSIGQRLRSLRKRMKPRQNTTINMQPAALQPVLQNANFSHQTAAFPGGPVTMVPSTSTFPGLGFNTHNSMPAMFGTTPTLPPVPRPAHMSMPGPAVAPQSVMPEKRFRMGPVTNTGLSTNAEDALKNYVAIVTDPPDDDDCCICCETINQPSGYGGENADIVEKLRKCGHMFHKLCINAMYNSGTKDGSLQCPTCKTVNGVKYGNCPPGRMEFCNLPEALPGYEGCSTISIVYYISPGTQVAGHPNPGQSYSTRGFPRHGYLPNNDEGNKVLKLLIKAWERRLTFTIGTSVTTGEGDTVVWNEIHHKTEFSDYHGHGYPDPKYLENVTMEMAAQGVVDSDDEAESAT